MTTTVTAYRTDQIGSLLRPSQLLDARDDYKAGNISLEALRKEEDASIAEALAMQRAVGIDVYSDGEMRRDAWQTNFIEAVDGFEGSYPIREVVRPDGTVAKVELHAKAVESKLRQARRLSEVDAAYMCAHAPGPFKITMPSPSLIARATYRPGLTDKVYTRDELQADATAIVRGEMKALVEQGVTYLQLDEGFNAYVNESWRKEVARHGRDLERVLQSDIAADNACYDGARHDGVTMAMHLCRGSRISWEHGAGGYDWLATRLFGALHVDRFLLEYDSDRIGSFEPLRHLPKGKVVVLGLVSSKTPQLERQDDLLRRLEEASKYVPLEQLALSTQCGFQGAADRDGAHMSMDEERRKLELIVETARKVWGG